MAESRAAIRYAKAILSLASDQKLADVVNNDMQLIAVTISDNADLNEALNSAVIQTESKKNILLQVFPDLNEATKKLIDVLVTNKRINILGQVATKYSQLFDELNGKQVAKVTTAIPMTSDLEAKVLAKLKELTNKSVVLESIVDESILGGFILQVGDKQYNASIANKLNKLKREFTLN
ncbi:ATP synthase F1 subunit delta [Oceanihabitans sediminis]|uniref:ATP synthase F1 subunit delta n=1 Tax=Oceanihabitans sediminis TaxID=1812012 RepID=UPI00299DB63D|nr:ATP synthase F1 subunit delta [Oceanihabitans sediminis]MDX1772948.1 ATP synthase F1 subunit delta [Oceanihabitans sediminis]